MLHVPLPQPLNFASTSAHLMARVRPAASPRTLSTTQLGPSPPSTTPYTRVDYNHAARGYLRRPIVYLPTLAICTLLLYSFLSPSTTRHEQTFAGYSSRLHESLDKLDWRTHPKKPSLTTNAQGQFDEFACNPFTATGRLVVDPEHPLNNLWTPYDKRCKPSSYLNKLYRAEGDLTPLVPARGDRSSQRELLPWLMNKTVVIHGDSIDRFHLKDFCTFVGGELTLISPDHPASPTPYRETASGEHVEVGMDGQETQASRDRRHQRAQKEQFWEGRPREGWELTNPWVCDVAEYGFTLINVFTWGLQGAEEFFETERWYHPPGESTRRCFGIRPAADPPPHCSYLGRPSVGDYHASARGYLQSLESPSNHVSRFGRAQLGLLGPAQVHRGCVGSSLLVKATVC